MVHGSRSFAALFGGLVLASLALPAAAQKSPAEKAEKIRQLVERYEAYELFSGTVLVADAGEVLYEAGHGLANREWAAPNAPDVRFRLASMTKTFTAVLVMRLVQEGKLELDDTISDHLPAFPKEKGERITLHHLLTHSSGVPHYTSIPGWFEGRFRVPMSSAEFVSVIAALDLDFEPGEQTRYSNSGYYLLGEIIESVCGKPYDEVLQQRILRPLGMTRTGSDRQLEILDKRAADYTLASGGGYRNTPWVNMAVFKATGSLVSTVGDLYKLDQALYGDGLLSEESKAKLFDAESPYGWNVSTTTLEGASEPVRMVGYNGSIIGFNSMITRFPDHRHLVVLLNNTGVGFSTLRELTSEIAGILYGLPSKEDGIPLKFLLNRSIREGDLAAGIRRFEAERGRFQVDEGRLNAYGYRLLWGELPHEAVRGFELVVRELPGSANAHDSLGEAYRAVGREKLAIASYRRSLELDPDNAHARAVLAELGAPEAAGGAGEGGS